MYWIYYTSNEPLSWKDQLLIDYFRKQNDKLTIEIRSVDYKNDINVLFPKGLPNRIILSNLFMKENVDDSYYFLFLPIYLIQLCITEDIHFTYLNQEIENDHKDADAHLKQLFQLFNHLHDHCLYLNFWMFMNENIDAVENMLHQQISYSYKFSIDSNYYLSVTEDILPIIYDTITKKKTGAFEMANPTPMKYSQIMNLYSEYLDVNVDTRYMSDEDCVYLEHPSIDTSRLEKEYFILPSYQSVQRLFKRIRKSNMIVSHVELDKKTCVMVTGGYGFIGSNLVHHLYHRFPRMTIVNIDRLDYCSRRENLDDLLNSERVKCYEIDLCETQQLEDIMKTHHVQYVMHLAAQSHVDNSFNNSLQFSKDNVYGTHSLLEAAKNHGKLIRFLHVSTDEIYGETLQMQPFDECVLPNPTNPYAATKVGAEYIVKSYFHCFELPVLMIRGNNVYGPRQFPEKMIPKFITNVINGKACTVAGNGLMQRNFVHVEDVCNGLVTVLEKGKIDEIYNIGSHDEKTVLSIAHMIIQKIKGQSVNIEDLVEFVKDRYYNDFRYSINSEKIRKLGWTTKIQFDDGLEKTIKYYTENLDIYNTPEERTPLVADFSEE